MRILFLESPMQNCGDFERTIWFDSVIQARPRFTLSYMPEEVLVETTNHKEEFEVEESWDLVELINERRLQQQDRNSPND
jgi:hypothetical protein